MHIVIAGNIGSGKTTLTKMLAKHYGWDLRLESVTYNPYLEDYYKDMPRWALNLEVYFLKERFRDLLEINRSIRPVIQDRSIYEGVYIFRANNHDMGNMSDRDFDTYMGLFNSMMMVVQKPDLMVYLKASVAHLVDNIHKRGREYEQNMRLDYLKNLNDRYDKFFQKQYKGPRITVDVENLDFVRNKGDFALITSSINKKIDMSNRNLFI